MATCDTVSVEAEPVSNESRIDIPNVRTSSPAPGVIEAEINVRNTLLSGDGEQLSPTINVSVSGNRVDSFSMTVAPGSTQSKVVRIEGVESGNQEVCAEVA